jgi:glutathione S-transferase
MTLFEIHHHPFCCLLDGITAYESHAIMRYLANRFNVDDHWYPKDAVRRLRVDQYLDWHHTGLRAASSIYVWSAAIGP